MLLHKMFEIVLRKYYLFIFLFFRRLVTKTQKFCEATRDFLFDHIYEMLDLLGFFGGPFVSKIVPKWSKNHFYFILLKFSQRNVYIL